MPDRIMLHAVVRYDSYLRETAADVSSLVAIVAVLPTREQAEREVLRLRQLSGTDGGSSYFWAPARYYPNGRQPQV